MANEKKHPKETEGSPQPKKIRTLIFVVTTNPAGCVARICHINCSLFDQGLCEGC